MSLSWKITMGKTWSGGWQKAPHDINHITFCLALRKLIKKLIFVCLFVLHEFFNSPTFSPPLPPYTKPIAKNMSNALESSYDSWHDSNISNNKFISKYIDIEAIESDTSIRCNESWSAFVLVNLFAFVWPSLCFATHFYIIYYDSMDVWIWNACFVWKKMSQITRIT